MALLVDYVSPAPSFCSYDSGCGAVRHSGLGYVPLGPFALPVPALGVLAFAFLFASTLQRSARMRAAVAAPLSYAVSIVSLVFVGLQVWMGHFCWMCMIVDVCGVVVGLSAWVLRGPGWETACDEEESSSTLLDPIQLMSEGQRVKGVWRDDSQVYAAPNPLVRPVPEDPFRLGFKVWLLLALLAFAAPLGHPLLVRTSEVPSVVRALYGEANLTVLEFFDFQCPHCRHLSPRLKAIVDEHPKFQLRYGYVPLPGHPEARPAARITICAAEQGKENEVAAAFFSTSRFDSDHLLDLAGSIVPKPSALSECLLSNRPDARIDADTEVLKAAGFVGLPTTYVGGIRILGAQEDVVYRDALERVLEGRDESGLHPWVYWVGVLLVTFALVFMGRVEKVDRQSIPGRLKS